MKFKKEELPQPVSYAATSALLRGSLVVDEDGIPWQIGDVNQVRPVYGTDASRSVIGHMYPAYQLVWRRDKLQHDQQGMWLEMIGEVVPVYAAQDLVRVIQEAEARFDASLATK